MRLTLSKRIVDPDESIIETSRENPHRQTECEGDHSFVAVCVGSWVRSRRVSNPRSAKCREDSMPTRWSAPWVFCVWFARGFLVMLALRWLVGASHSMFQSFRLLSFGCICMCHGGLPGLQREWSSAFLRSVALHPVQAGLRSTMALSGSIAAAQVGLFLSMSPYLALCIDEPRFFRLFGLWLLPSRERQVWDAKVWA